MEYWQGFSNLNLTVLIAEKDFPQSYFKTPPFDKIKRGTERHCIIRIQFGMCGIFIALFPPYVLWHHRTGDNASASE